MRAIAIVGLALLGCTPTAPIVYECILDRHCFSSRGERCIFDGDTGRYCAQPDSSCPSGFRWNELALPKLAEQCVDPSLVRVDGGA